MKTERVLNDTFRLEIKDHKEIAKGVKALETLGFKVKKIEIGYVHANFFFYNYYKKYDTELLTRLQNQLKKTMSNKVTIKNNRMYIEFEGEKIILPIDTTNIHDDSLYVFVIVE